MKSILRIISYDWEGNRKELKIRQDDIQHKLRVLPFDEIKSAKLIHDFLTNSSICASIYQELYKEFKKYNKDEI